MEGRLTRYAVALSAMLLAGCGHLYEKTETRRDRVEGYIARLELGDDHRAPSLRSYGRSFASLLDTDRRDDEAYSEAVHELIRDQACLTVTWGWRATEHRTALISMLVDGPDTDRAYMDYLARSSKTALGRGDPCADRILPAHA